MTNDLTTTIHTYLSSAPSSEFNGLPVHVADHWEGSENLLWRVEAGGTDAVLKLFLDAGQARSRRQYDGQMLCAPLGLAPEPLWVDRYPEGLARQVLVYRWTDGEPFQPAKSDHLLASARAVARLHTSDPGAVRRFCPNPINLAYLWRLMETSAARVERWLARLDTPLFGHVAELNRTTGHTVENALPLWDGAASTPVHGDLKGENLIVQFREAILLDWEQFGLGDPAQDAATFLHRHRNDLGDELRHAWLDEYLAEHDQPQIEQRIATYLTVLPVRDLLYLLDGLRELAARPAELTEHRAALPFLAETIAASMGYAAQQFDRHGAETDPQEIRRAVDDLIKNADD